MNDPSESGIRRDCTSGDGELDPRSAMLEELQAREETARQMGGEVKLAALRERGVLNARARVSYFLDPGSFRESGLLAVSQKPGMAERTPADGKVVGFGRVDGREVAVVSNDFTVLGASSSDINSAKIRHVTDTARRSGLPLVMFGESSGGRIPDAMGASGFSPKGDPNKYRRTRDTPWASAILGKCYGSAAWYAARSDFRVMRRGAVMGVASPRLVSAATSERVDEQELGGWEVHASRSGMVDQAVDTDEEALDAIRRFLGYLPSHSNEAPPVVQVPPGSDEASGIFDIVPLRRSTAYNMIDLIRAIVDQDSTFELKQHFARNLITCLARIDGKSVGIVANNPRYMGGIIDADACSKATSFLVLCDSYNIPIVFLVDQPGLLIGKDGERKGATGKVMNWLNALSLVTVPFFAIIIRKNYGQSRDNMGVNVWASEIAAWPTAEMSFMDPAFAVPIVYGNLRREDDPARFDRLVEEISRSTTVYDMAGTYGVQTVLDPPDTRSYLKDVLEIHRRRLSGGVGEHMLRTWPTSYL